MLQNSNSSVFADRFLALVQNYDDFVSAAGKRVRRLPEAQGRALFLSFPVEQQADIVARIESELVLFQEVLAAGDALTDSPKFVWRYLSRNGFVPCLDIFAKIQDTDVINIYGSAQTLIFQNLNFFDWISISLEDIFCATWYQATRRDSAITQILFETANRMIAGEIRETTAPHVPWHGVEEVESEELFSFDIRVKCLSPIFRDQSIAGILAVNECRNLRSRRNSI